MIETAQIKSRMQAMGKVSYNFTLTLNFGPKFISYPVIRLYA